MSDDSDVIAANPTNFQINAPNLEVSNTFMDFAERLSLFGTVEYYFEGTLDDSVATKTAKFNFFIDFQDECRTAIVVAQNLDLAPEKWR